MLPPSHIHKIMIFVVQNRVHRVRVMLTLLLSVNNDKKGAQTMDET